ncbi:MAG: zinc ABC transporter substrate-binding protein [Finegoldia magna]|uniref:metal ABC transporter solute-binding protein, Zn/Mn family n=1 Tax=Finegoldia magna TaxID=1260 RepID=UPI00290804B2|nr:zinc ABC transporter substrate-binding protein [Finegoldia magna]MDU4334081.1 zinc ABC transporter substrate-binding protein [Finegoldia magna]
MKKIYRILLLALMIGVASGCTRQNNDVNNQKVQEQKEKSDDKSTEKSDSKKLYVSFYPIEYMAKEIAKDKIEVVNVMPKGATVHDWEPTAQDIKNLSDSKMLIVNGLGLEGWLEDVKSSLKNTEIVDSSTNIDKIKAEEDHDHDHEEHDHDHDHEEKGHDHDHEEKEHGHDHEHHHHGEFDPHVWMSPKQARIQMKNVYEAIIKFDSENKDFYEKNYKELDKKFEELDKKYAEVLAPQKDKYFIVPHEAFGYLARDYEINQVPIEGINSDSEPDLNKMKELTNFAKSHKINTVFYEMGESDKIANSLAKEINAKTAGLSTIEAKTQDIEDGKDNYFSLLEKNLDAISQAK